MKRTLIAFALFAALPLGAAAADLDYTYIEGGYAELDLDGGSDPDGWSVGGSAALGENFHIFGSFGSFDYDVGALDLDADRWRIGLGWNRSVSDNSDLVVRANYLEFDTDIADIDGWEAEVGLRSAIGANFETYVALGYADGDDINGEVYGKLGAQYKFNPTWGIVASATVLDGGNEIFVGPRISF